MDYADYVSGVSFCFIQPHSPPPNPALMKRLERFGLSLELMNTHIPSGERTMKQSLRKICKIPKMSTFAVGAMINAGVSQMADGEAFVNVGVWHGFTFFSGLINHPKKKCIGVDNFSGFGGPKETFMKMFNTLKGPAHRFYEMDYLQYFSTVHQEPIGFYLYDGDHSYENQLQGLKVAEPFFSDRCIILVDDTNWDEPRRATMGFITQSSKSYRIIFDQTTCRNGHPTLWNGITILQRIPSLR